VGKRAGSDVGVGVSLGGVAVEVGTWVGVGWDAVGVAEMVAGVNVGKARGSVSHGVLDAAGGDIAGVACEQATIKIGKRKKRALIRFTDCPVCIYKYATPFWGVARDKCTPERPDLQDGSSMRVRLADSCATRV
jgi:hypothetical protein